MKYPYSLFLRKNIKIKEKPKLCLFISSIVPRCLLMLTDFQWNHSYDKALATRNWLSRPDCTIQRAATPAPSGVLSSLTMSIPPPHIVRRLCRLPSSRGQWRSTWYGVSSSCPHRQAGDLNSGTPIQYRKLASPVRRGA